MQSDCPGHLINSSHPWWRSPLVGYASSLLFILCAFLFLWLQTLKLLYGYFIGSIFVIGTFLVGWIWGMGPGLLALAVGTICTDYLIVPPIHTFAFSLWPDPLSILPFVLIQWLILWLIVRHKNAQAQLLCARQELADYAEQVVVNNRELAESNALSEQANRIKDQFLSLASHELRTPVTSISGHIQLLQRQFKRQSEQNPAFLPAYASLCKVNEQIQRFVGLMNDLLDINSLRSGRIPLRLAPCDLRCLCRKGVEEQTALEGRLLDLHFPPEPAVVLVDEKRFSQVLANLLSNALKYSPHDTTIHVEVKLKPEKAILLVQNEGPLLSKDQQHKIFEPFYRSPEAQSSAIPGWGLGLAISKEIVEQHGGSFWVESSEGKGTTFFVALSLYEDSEMRGPETCHNRPL